MPVFATPNPIDVVLDVAAGNIRVIASDRDDTVVEVRPSRPGRAADVKTAEKAEIEYFDGRLRVRTAKVRLGWIGPSDSVDVTIELPLGSSVQGAVAAGNLRTEGRLGACRMKSGAGDLTVDAAGPVQLRTGAGSIVVGTATGDAELHAATGSVRLGDVYGDAAVTSSYGDTTIGEVSGLLTVKGAYGSIWVDRAGSSASIKTAHGGVRIAEVTAGEVDLESSFGGLEVGIAQGTAAWIDVSTEHGTVTNTLSVGDGPAESERTVQVRAHSSWGDIVIRRA
ncbi:DUF4097 domain-containing protein [Agromyces sp. NPDC058136]|uniref:DUF4097 family beta strand repeat-containing protein n=1 Tax=Agromyces sp. NPDC058136 TaxID=3346354 RepID=UPI0036DA6160